MFSSSLPPPSGERGKVKLEANIKEFCVRISINFIQMYLHVNMRTLRRWENFKLDGSVGLQKRFHIYAPWFLMTENYVKTKD